MLAYRLDPVTPVRQCTLTVESTARSFPFYLYECGSYEMGDRYFTRRDGQENYLMILTTGGSGFMTWHGRTVDLTPGTLVLIDCTDLQVYGTTPGSTWSFSYIHFGASRFEGYRKLLLETLSAPHLVQPDSAARLFNRLFAVSTQASLSAYAEESHLISSLLLDMVQSLDASAALSASDTRTEMHRLAAYISDHCTQPLSLDDLSVRTHLSKYHLIRVFTAQIGITPGRYLHLCRINRAQQLLRSTDRSIGDISSAVGYTGQAVFIRHFRAFHGVTPGEYRKNCIVECEKGNGV